MLDVNRQSGLGRVTALVAAGAAALAAAGAAPRIATPQAIYAFGWRDSAETVTNRFTLRNTGDATLHISDIRTSCACSRVEPERRALEAGEETSLEVRTALRGLNGRVRKSVTVVSNDPDTPYLSLWVEGEARAAVCLEPPNVAFGRIDPGEPPAPVTVRLDGYLTNVTITAAVSDDAAYAITVAPAGRLLTVAPPRPAAAGPCRAVLRVTLSDPAQPTLALPLYAWLDDLLRIAPTALAFRPSAEPASTRLVIVRPGTAKRFRISAAWLEGGTGTTRIVSRPDCIYQVALEGVIPDTLTTNAALVIRTDLPAHPEWRLPLRLEGHREP
jgi:hypothetical protein